MRAHPAVLSARQTRGLAQAGRQAKLVASEQAEAIAGLQVEHPEYPQYPGIECRTLKVPGGNAEAHSERGLPP